MTRHAAQRLLGGYAFSTLTPEEQGELRRAALDDQEIFDALVDDEALRQALADPAVRRELLLALERPTLRDRLRRWLHQPATLGHLSAATLVMFVAFASWQLVAPLPIRGLNASGTAPQAMPPTDVRMALFGLPLRTSIPGSLHGEPPAFRLSVDAPARALIVEKTSTGAVQLFPGPGIGSAVSPERELAFAASGKPGLHRVRVLLCPLDLEPLSLDPQALAVLAARLTVIERTYEVPEGGQAP